LDRLATAIEKALVWQGEYAEFYTGIEDPGLFFNDFYLWQRIPKFREWAYYGPGPDNVFKAEII